jgi:hypothetical protein
MGSFKQLVSRTLLVSGDLTHGQDARATGDVAATVGGRMLCAAGVEEGDNS